MRPEADNLMKVTVIDQMGRSVEVSQCPKRIISLVPSQTELLLDLGVNVVGRTKFCTHPKERLESIPIIGGTKKFRFDEIRALNPDLIIGNKEENYEEGIVELSNKYPVWMSDITTIQDAIEMIRKISDLCGVSARGNSMSLQIERELELVKDKFSGSVLYLIWKNPWMAVGTGTFINSILTHLGFDNVITANRYPELTDEQINDFRPDYVFFSSEPYPFKENDLLQDWSSKNIIVDGEMFSWYGSRILKAVEYFRSFVI